MDTADFTLTATGITGASVTSVSGSLTIYTVTINTGTGSGTLRLNVVDNDSIIDGSSNPLGGTGAGNGNYTSGETYDVRPTTFIDVPTTYWAWDWIERLYHAGVTTGCIPTSPMRYCPEDNVTRAEMAKFLVTTFNLPCHWNWGFSSATRSQFPNFALFSPPPGG